MKSQKEERMVPESNESLEKLVLLIPKSRRITVTDIRAITGSITGPLIWRSLELGRGEGFITGWGGGWLRGGIEHPPRLWNPEDRPLILCAHENLRELWQAAVLVFENAFPPKPSSPSSPAPYNRNSREREYTRQSCTHSTREKRARMVERTKVEPCSIGRSRRARRREGEVRMQIGLREEICKRTTAAQCGRGSVCIGMQPAGCNGKGNNWYIAMALAADSR